MRRSKVFKAALQALTWPDGSSRWDTTRVNSCFHCGKRRSDLKRNVCTPCRTDDFVPHDAPAGNPMAGGYRVCTDHCTTVPLPLDLFAPGNKKCQSCLDKRRQRKLRKKARASASGASATPSAKRRRGSAATASPSLSALSPSATAADADASHAAYVGRSFRARKPRGVAALDVLSGELEEAPCRLVPARQSARRARTRIAAIGADAASPSDAEYDDGEEEYHDEGRATPCSVSTVTGDEGPHSPAYITSSSSPSVVLPITPTPTLTRKPSFNAPLSAPLSIPAHVRMPVKPPSPIKAPVPIAVPSAVDVAPSSATLFGVGASPFVDWGLLSPSCLTPAFLASGLSLTPKAAATTPFAFDALDFDAVPQLSW